MKPKLIMTIVTALLSGLFFLSACATSSKSGPYTKLPRTYRIDPDSKMGLIYGKIRHNRVFGKKFVITFKNRATEETLDIPVECFVQTETEKNLFMEFEPGEWAIDKITAADRYEAKVADLRTDENKEFVVEKAGIYYVGTWIISRDSFEVLDEKQEQDQFMRINYKNVMTTGALVMLP
ncbi:hypothetical protein ACFL5V_10200 [Fibrobacterota bacterium]